MKRLVFTSFCLVLFRVLVSAESVGAHSFLSVQERVQDIFNSSKDCVVRVKATRKDILGDKPNRVLKMGSGFFVSKDGHVLTTGLLRNADQIWIEHLQSFYLAQLIGHDYLCNVSMLKIIEPNKEFPFLSVSDDVEDLTPGSILVGLTCALEFKVGPTFGLFQSEEISFGTSLFPTKMLRSSLPLGPGEIGAPIFDLNGRFVGISHAALTDLGSSFILPADACLRIRDGLMLSGKVDYGWFGVTVSRKLNSQNSFDIVVEGTVDGSPASKSYLKKGDRIKKIGSVDVLDRGDLAHAAFFAQPGTVLTFLVNRDDKVVSVPIKVEKRSVLIKEEESQIAEVDGAVPGDDSFETEKPTVP
ncbi:MAG: S1C family serine protease [Opitutae bacterium]